MIGNKKPPVSAGGKTRTDGKGCFYV